MEEENSSSDTNSREVQSRDTSNEDEQARETSSNILQTLLSRLGGFTDSFAPNPSIGRGKLNNLLEGLKDMENEGAQLQSLMELCDFLSIGTEETMSNFPIDLFVEALSNLLNMEHNPDMMLLACRALAYMLEALPSSGSSIVAREVIPMLCAKLLAIEYIDLAEQALQKLSHEHPTAILRAGGLTAVLSFLDFFSIGTQRSAVTTAANICRQIPHDCYDMVIDNIPTLTNLLQYEDSKLVEKVVVCFARLAESFYGNKEQLQKLAGHGLLSHLIRLISVNPSGISPATYTLALRLITTLCSGTPELSQEILAGDIGSVLHQALVGSESGDSSRNVSTEQLYEILSLLNELLPPLPKEVSAFMPNPLTISGLVSRSRSLQRSQNQEEAKEKKEEPSSSEAEEDEESEEEEEDDEKEILAEKLQTAPPSEESSDPRVAIVTSNPVLLSNLGENLFPLLLQLYSATVNASLRYKCLTALTKLLYFSTSDVLETLLKSLSVSSFIANLMSSSDNIVTAASLKMCEILMEKLPQIFTIYFKREGVLYEVQRVASRAKDSPADKSEDGDISQWIIEHAQQMLQKHFKDDSEEDISLELKELKRISSSLNSRIVSQLPTAEGDISLYLTTDEELFVALNKVLVGEEGVSTFEFMQSSLATTLLNYLVTPHPNFTGQLSEKEENLLTERARMFTNVLLKPVPPPNDPTGPPEPPRSFLVLIHKLHHSLNKAERFPVYLNEVPGTAAGIKYLTQPFKLVVEEDGKQKSSSEEPNVILIEPLATVGALEDYLKAKLETKEPEEKETKVRKKSKQLLQETEDMEDTTEGVTEEMTSVDLQTKPEKETSGRLRLRGDGVWLERNQSLFQALTPIARSAFQVNDSPFATHRMWERLYRLTYVFETIESEEEEEESETSLLQTQWAHALQYPPSLSDTPLVTQPVLHLLRVLHDLNWLWSTMIDPPSFTSLGERPLVTPVEWVNNKVTSKVVRQLQDPLTLCSGALPSWSLQTIHQVPFLYPFEVRRLAWTAGSLGIARSLQASQQVTNLLGSSQMFSSTRTRPGDLRLGRIPRQKVRVSRDRILASAVKVMQLYGSGRALVEVEYFGEVGTGLGPTLEFFTLVSRELQKRQLSLAGGFSLWRDVKASQEGEEFVHAPFGLFPAPINPSDTSEQVEQVIQLFHFVGVFVAKALLDQRLVDLSFASSFFKWMRGEPFIFADLKGVDPDLWAQLHKMWDICQQKKTILNDDTLSAEEQQQQIASLTMGGISIEDLDLDFTFPSDPKWELKPNGAEESVTIESLEEYLDLLVNAHLRSGVRRQLTAFRQGFNSVFPINSLAIFTNDELESLMCGNDDTPWDMQTLLENTRCEHGYSHQNKTVQFLLEIMTEMNASERRQFLLFVTGSAKLPLGGFKSLEPKLTIVRRDPDQNDPNSYLPSVNCCFYYLKLPEYSDKEMLKEKLNFAIQHGQGSFSFN